MAANKTTATVKTTRAAKATKPEAAKVAATKVTPKAPKVADKAPKVTAEDKAKALRIALKEELKTASQELRQTNSEYLAAQRVAQKLMRDATRARNKVDAIEAKLAKLTAKPEPKETPKVAPKVEDVTARKVTKADRELHAAVVAKFTDAGVFTKVSTEGKLHALSTSKGDTVTGLIVAAFPGNERRDNRLVIAYTINTKAQDKGEFHVNIRPSSFLGDPKETWSVFTTRTTVEALISRLARKYKLASK